MIFMDV
jgi:hypothetical protein